MATTADRLWRHEEKGTSMPMTDVELAHQYRLAQARRLIRFCEGRILAEVTDAESAAIFDRAGKIVSEAEDLDAVRRGDEEAWDIVDGRLWRVRRDPV
jgi:hypothetical protein